MHKQIHVCILRPHQNRPAYGFAYTSNIHPYSVGISVSIGVSIGVSISISVSIRVMWGIEMGH
jgi:hypothetical protein